MTQVPRASLLQGLRSMLITASLGPLSHSKESPNFSLLVLPNTCSILATSKEQGKFPTARQVPVCLQRQLVRSKAAVNTEQKYSNNKQIARNLNQKTQILPQNYGVNLPTCNIHENCLQFLNSVSPLQNEVSICFY